MNIKRGDIVEWKDNYHTKFIGVVVGFVFQQCRGLHWVRVQVVDGYRKGGKFNGHYHYTKKTRRVQATHTRMFHNTTWQKYGFKLLRRIK